MQHRILNYRSHSVNIDQSLEQVDEEIDCIGLNQPERATCLKKSDIESLQHVVITQKLPLRKALFTAIHTAYSLIRIRQSYFEPVFNRYADKQTYGYLNLEGSFYQSLLFIASSNISNLYLDSASQQTASMQMNERARELVNQLKKVKKLQFVSLPKYTNLCLNLDLLEFIPATLKRLGKGALLKLPKSMLKFSEALQEINPSFAKNNQLLHHRCEKYLQNNEIA